MRFGTVWIAGVGEGLGSALARAFAPHCRALLLTARTTAVTGRLAQELGTAERPVLARPCDAALPEAVAAVHAEAQAHLGPVEVLVYNVGNMVRGAADAMDPEVFARALAAGPYGAFLHARLVLPRMVEKRQGVLLFTGATSSVRAPAAAPAFAAAKFGLRGLAMALHRAYGPKGVHVGHVLVDGVIRTPVTVARLGPTESYLSPEAIAASFVHLALQPASAWTFELDLRPSPDDYLEN